MTSSPYDNSVQAGQVVELLLAKRAIRFHPIRRAGVRATVARVGDIGLSRACTPAEFAGGAPRSPRSEHDSRKPSSRQPPSSGVGFTGLRIARTAAIGAGLSLVWPSCARPLHHSRLEVSHFLGMPRSPCGNTISYRASRHVGRPRRTASQQRRSIAAPQIDAAAMRRLIVKL
jgi:hypothetical protein